VDAATYLGIPGVYHVIGVAVARKVIWNNAANIVVAWIVTLPASGAHGRAVLRYAEIPFTPAIASRGCCRQIGERRSMAVAKCADLNWSASGTETTSSHVRCLVALGGQSGRDVGASPSHFMDRRLISVRGRFNAWEPCF